MWRPASFRSLIVVARTSNAPRKIEGNPSTLFTWLGKSDRPVAMIRSGRVCTATAYGISGSGLARAKTIGFSAIARSISGVTQFATDKPKKTSAPCKASARVRISCLDGKSRLVAVHSFRAAFEHDPFRVTHHDVLAANPEPDVVLGASNSGRTRAVEHDSRLVDLLTCDLQSLSRAAPEMIAVPCWSSWNTGILRVRRSSSSISKHSGALMSSRFMPPNVGSNNWQARMISFGSSARKLYIEDVNVGEALEEYCLPFHHWLPRGRADVAEAQHSGAIGYNGNQVCLCVYL